MGESPLNMCIEAPRTVNFPLSDPIAITPGDPIPVQRPRFRTGVYSRTFM
jgi:hypothetical protein